LVVDKTGIGDAVVDEMQYTNIPNVEGVFLTEPVKEDILNHLKFVARALFFRLSIVVGVVVLAGGDSVFHQSVSGELYEWLLKEQKRRGADSIQKTVRQVLQEVKEARKDG